MLDFVHSSCFQGMKTCLPEIHIILFFRQCKSCRIWRTGRRTTVHRRWGVLFPLWIRLSHEKNNSKPPTSDFRRWTSLYIVCLLKQPDPRSTCICDRLYNPDKDDLMHFCPRSLCHRSFHRDCLLKAGWIESPEEKGYKADKIPRAVRLERTVLNSRVVDTLKPLPFKPTSTRGRGRPKKDAAVETYVDPYSEISTDLLELARSPMVKGLKLPSAGLVGNLAAVSLARQFVCAALNDGKSYPSDWRKLVGLGKYHISSWVVDDVGLICPSCKGAIWKPLAMFGVFRSLALLSIIISD